MSLRQRAGHWLLRRAVAPRARRFAAQASQLESVQRRKLASLLACHLRAAHRFGDLYSWEDFQRKVPVSGFDCWREDIERWKSEGEALVDSRLMRFQPTSGSTSAIRLAEKRV